MSAPQRKRPRVDGYSFTESYPTAADVRARRSSFLASLNQGVSPPASPAVPKEAEMKMPLHIESEEEVTSSSAKIFDSKSMTVSFSRPRVVPSAFKITRIRDLPAGANADTISIRDILGDVMLKEVWLFDFMYDVDWVMQQFDPDIRPFVSVILVHGSWRREDSNRVHIDEASKRHPNVKVVTAHMPEMYGCHHSKCMVLFRHDDLAQVIIHTANMIEQDWRNMTQGVWLSPLLPARKDGSSKDTSSTLPALGTGARFKQDFLAYLRYYGNRTTSLVSQLEQYDFTTIRAALIAHVPAKFNGKETKPEAQLWGWPALKRALGSIPSQLSAEENPKDGTTPHIVCQVSSIASLAEKWIHGTLFSTLLHSASPSTVSPSAHAHISRTDAAKPRFSIIFPTVPEVRASLDGYAAGASIHCKLQTPSQRKQFEVTKPHLCRWDPQTESTPAHATTNTSPRVLSSESKALRGPAAPHIKTFIRFHDDNSRCKEIDWALLTSANLSTQAWGLAANSVSDEVRVSSYELGVLLWPGLFLDDTEAVEGKKRRVAKMVPTFGSDVPSESQIQELVVAQADTERSRAKNPDRVGNENVAGGTEDMVIVGLRMPYDLPLTPYTPEDEIWSARASYAEPDRFGRAWNI